MMDLTCVFENLKVTVATIVCMVSELVRVAFEQQPQSDPDPKKNDGDEQWEILERA